MMETNSTKINFRDWHYTEISCIAKTTNRFPLKIDMWIIWIYQRNYISHCLIIVSPFDWRWFCLCLRGRLKSESVMLLIVPISLVLTHNWGFRQHKYDKRSMLTCTGFIEFQDESGSWSEQSGFVPGIAEQIRMVPLWLLWWHSWLADLISGEINHWLTEVINFFMDLWRA